MINATSNKRRSLLTAQRVIGVSCLLGAVGATSALAVTDSQTVNQAAKRAAKLKPKVGSGWSCSLTTTKGDNVFVVVTSKSAKKRANKAIADLPEKYSSVVSTRRVASRYSTTSMRKIRGEVAKVLESSDDQGWTINYTAPSDGRYGCKVVSVTLDEETSAETWAELEQLAENYGTERVRITEAAGAGAAE